VAKIVILGGGFGGVTVAEELAMRIGSEHEIILVSRERQFNFYPALIKLAFGQLELGDISFDVREAMYSRGVGFIQGEVARVDPHSRRVVIAHGDVEGEMEYDYLVFALGRRLATERVKGFFEYGNHLLGLNSALKFGEAANGFHRGQAVLGSCPDARLPIPVYEAAFALSRLLEGRGEREDARITIVSPEPENGELGGAAFQAALNRALSDHKIEVIHNFEVVEITPGAVCAAGGQYLTYDLLALIPPFTGPGAVVGLQITDSDGFIRAEHTMRVPGLDRTYAVGDCVGFSGPKLGHMAVQQALVAAENLSAELNGKTPNAKYDHELMLVIDEGGGDSIYLHKHLWNDDSEHVHTGRFWGWAKWVQERYWKSQHE
jgi:sulfide:quinone oxidoreductase